MTTHKFLNRSSFAGVSNPGNSARLQDTIRSERAVLRAESPGSYNATVAGRNVTMLEELLASSKRNDAARDQLYAEIEAMRTAEHDALEATRRESLVNQLRVAYLDQPGVSEQDFEQALPELLRRRAEDAALNGEDEIERLKATAWASGRYSI